jgi:hypothetical protein
VNAEVEFTTLGGDKIVAIVTGAVALDSMWMPAGRA